MFLNLMAKIKSQNAFRNEQLEQILTDRLKILFFRMEIGFIKKKIHISEIGIVKVYEEVML